MINKIVIIISGLLSLSVQAEVYRCAIDKYQDRPCDEHSEAIDMSHIGSIVVPLARTSADSPTPKQVDAHDVNEQKASISNYIRSQKINRDIDKLVRERKRTLAERDQKIAQLHKSRQLASNNLAGATWEQSLAQEMSAVNQQAETVVASLDRQIKAHEKQLRQLNIP
ncbi:hypothetical protein ACFOD0_11520 [Shewanella intestini]|uniref:RNA-binding protein n=1 Tax=Shewanella intestini TaxID=2017544 RepID=A0ABS5I305_9GAMM|nr:MULTISPECIES: hypothetical protein [Shewanella]MBR9728412.1 hypothetical protein [Shewanella intestini]MRG36754.1 hypothetical protein [Shewanella sp. XMDDZSB0408]